MRKTVWLLTSIPLTLAAFCFSPLERVLANSASLYQWGINNNSSSATGDQGGSIELGGAGNNSNPVSGGQPYIDFHYGNGTSQDYSARLIANADNTLSVVVPNNTLLSASGTGLTFNNGITSSGSGLKHMTVTGCSAIFGTAGYGGCSATFTWPGTPFRDTNYTVLCVNESSNSTYTIYVDTSQNTTTTSTVSTVATVNGDGSSHVQTGPYSCLAVHD